MTSLHIINSLSVVNTIEPILDIQDISVSINKPFHPIEQLDKIQAKPFHPAEQLDKIQAKPFPPVQQLDSLGGIILNETIRIASTCSEIKATYVECGGTQYYTVITELGLRIPSARWQDTSYEPCPHCGSYPRDSKSTCRTRI